jgi:hypothetical protein
LVFPRPGADYVAPGKKHSKDGRTILKRIYWIGKKKDRLLSLSRVKRINRYKRKMLILIVSVLPRRKKRHCQRGTFTSASVVNGQ